jgi:hypothetical protein
MGFDKETRRENAINQGNVIEILQGQRQLVFDSYYIFFDSARLTD